MHRCRRGSHVEYQNQHEGVHAGASRQTLLAVLKNSEFAQKEKLFNKNRETRGDVGSTNK
jgi:hypothetical protein